MLSPWPRTKGSLAQRIQLVSAPTAEPISFDLAKTALKIGNINASSFAIQSKIAAARGLIENELHRCLVQQTYDLFLDDEAFVGSGLGSSLRLWNDASFGDHVLGLPEIQLPLPPTQAVLGVYTTDETGLESPVDPTIYTVTRSKEPCRVRLTPGARWPAYRSYEGFRIRFTAGYVAPLQLAADGSQLLCRDHGYRSGDTIRFSSHDGTLPFPLVIRQNYLLTNLTDSGFQVMDLAGNLVDLTSDQALGWVGTAFLGEIPGEMIEALVMVSGLNQGGEIRPRVPGGTARLNSIELPVSPMELLAKYIWAVL